MPGAANKNLAAAGTIRVGRVAVDIAFVDVMKSRIESNSPRGVERLRGRPGLVSQLEVGMKRREVQRHIRAEMLQNPVGELPDFARVIVQRGNQEIRDLKPDIRFLLEPRERVEHGLQMRERDAPVKFLRETL